MDFLRTSHERPASFLLQFLDEISEISVRCAVQHKSIRGRSQALVPDLQGWNSFSLLYWRCDLGQTTKLLVHLLGEDNDSGYHVMLL
jgi:hypothetical protein